jgi:hypothetical protein
VEYLSNHFFGPPQLINLGLGDQRENLPWKTTSNY